MERISLQIQDLPQEVYVGKTYQYFVRLRNDEAYPVTVALISNQDDFVPGVTIPANSHEDVEITSEFKDTGKLLIKYTALKNGIDLDFVSQVVEVIPRENDVQTTKNTEKSTKLNNIVAEIFIRILAQVVGAILLNFTLLRLGTWLNIISFPWLDGWPEFFIWFIPWEAFVGLFGVGFLIAGLFSNGFGKGMIAAIFSIAICLIIMFNTMPNFFQVVFWSGENGERMEVTLKPGIMTVIVGGDGHRIWLHNDPNAKNPSLEKLINFLRNDKTDQHPYVIGSFVCADFAETLHNDAEKAGIRAAYVSVNTDHALNAFNTTDKGLIYVDDGGLDTIAHVVIGDKYTIEPLWPEDRNRLASVTVNVGIVEDFQIDW
jgi:hypothetical protein